MNCSSGTHFLEHLHPPALHNIAILQVDYFLCVKMLYCCRWKHVQTAKHTLLTCSEIHLAVSPPWWAADNSCESDHMMKLWSCYLLHKCCPHSLNLEQSFITRGIRASSWSIAMCEIWCFCFAGKDIDLILTLGACVVGDVGDLPQEIVALNTLIPVFSWMFMHQFILV